MLFEYFPHLPFGALVASFLWATVIGVVGHSLVFRTRLFEVLLKSPMVRRSSRSPRSCSRS